MSDLTTLTPTLPLLGMFRLDLDSGSLNTTTQTATLKKIEK